MMRGMPCSATSTTADSATSGGRSTPAGTGRSMASERPSEARDARGREANPASGGTDEDLIDLHTSWWERRSEDAIVNDDCGLAQRFRHVAALPDAWLD